MKEEVSGCKKSAKMDEDLKYDKRQVDLFDELSLEDKKVLEWIGENKTVLEVGCHTGNLAKWLKRCSCHVTGIDINKNAIQIASKYLDVAIEADIENNETWQKFFGEKYEIITLMHVLEHLVNPWDTLKRILKFLAPGGTIIIALPNICNAKDRFNITWGKFVYTEIGVLDRTHLHFFTQDSARELIRSVKLQIDEYYSPWRVNPIREFIDHFPILNKFRNLLKPTPPRFLKFPTGITDTVMMFKCSLT